MKLPLFISGTLLVLSAGVFLPRLLPSPLRPLEVSARSLDPIVPFRAAATSPGSTETFLRFLGGEAPRLAAGEVAPFLEQNRRNASSLIAAFLITDDRAYLSEAMEKFPNDPQVSLAAAVDRACAPEQRRQWLDLFKGSAPDNALANYLSASDYLKSGQTDLALQDLASAACKPGFTGYWLERSAATEQAYRAAGFSEAESLAAAISARSPEFVELRELNIGLTGLVKSHQAAGDAASAQAVLQRGMELGGFLEQPGTPDTFATRLMALDIKAHYLGLLPPNTTWAATGQTAENLRAQIKQRRDAIIGLRDRAERLLSSLSEQQALGYARHVRAFGSFQASEWLISAYRRDATAAR